MMVLRAPARRALWRPEHAREIDDAVAPAARAWDRARDLPPLLAARCLDYETLLPGAILTKVDIAAMAHGLEVRTPLARRSSHAGPSRGSCRPCARGWRPEATRAAPSRRRSSARTRALRSTSTAARFGA
jgi:hypothetical protein